MVYFCQIFDVFFRLYNPFPSLDPRRPLHMLYICIATFNYPKGILGLGGKASKNKLHIFNDKRHNFKYISYACAEGIPQILEMKGTYILNILEFLLFENLQRIY